MSRRAALVVTIREAIARLGWESTTRQATPGGMGRMLRPTIQRTPTGQRWTTGLRGGILIRILVAWELSLHFNLYKYKFTQVI